MQKIQLYLKDAYNELVNKVSWPTWAELQSSAVVVMVASLIIALVVFAIDLAFQGTLNLFYQMFV